MRRYTIEIAGRAYVIDVNEVTADSFDVRIGDDAFQVTVAAEEDMPEAAIVPGESADVAAPDTTAPAVRIARKAPATQAAAASLLKTGSGSAGSGSLAAPMPGVIIEVAVKAGDTVTRGQLVAVLDAMKMHNNIRSPRAGTIAEVCVTAGQAVGHGDAIVRFREG
jgi:biotin carboxyl carrier protein